MISLYTRTMKQPRIVVTFPKAQMARLKKYCDKTGMRMAEVIRRGVDQYIGKRKKAVK